MKEDFFDEIREMSRKAAVERFERKKKQKTYKIAAAISSGDARLVAENPAHPEKLFANYRGRFVKK